MVARESEIGRARVWWMTNSDRYRGWKGESEDKEGERAKERSSSTWRESER